MPSTFRRVVRWVPSAVLAVVLVACWAAFFAGGMASVVGRTVLLIVAPFFGAITLLVALTYVAVRRRFSAPIAASVGLSLFALWPGAWSFGVAQIPYPSSLATSSPAATVRLPSDQPLTVAWGGDRSATNYHAYLPAQRWAYDLFVAPYMGGTSRLSDYGCWSTPVVAPINAQVHAAHDGEPDAEPGKPSNNATKPFGNFVALKMPTETFLIVAHLERCSVNVKVGDTVVEGQLLGRCGNSGNTSEPHIHIHHQRQDPLIFPVGVAEGLPLYFRDHDGAPMPEGGIEVQGEKAIAKGAVVKHVGSTGSAAADAGAPQP